MSRSTCITCGGWGCRRCKPPHDVAASESGEQGLTAAELEVVALRNENAKLRELLRAASYWLAPGIGVGDPCSLKAQIDEVLS